MISKCVLYVNNYDILKQAHRMKTSSKPEYQFLSSIEPGSLLPATVEAKQVDKLGSTNEPGYIISGTLGNEYGEWPEPPHIALANLRADDPKSAEAFIRRYGVLFEGRRGFYMNDDPVKIVPKREFSIKSSDLKLAQSELLAAWEGDSAFIVLMEGRVVEGMETDVLVDTSGDVLLRPRSLLATISFVFLRDYRSRKLGICENPDCPAPYFRKKRSTQKFCEAGPCVAYAQRRYALRWWNTAGKERRQRKRANHQNKGKEP
jgi:hypothetical protein